jgi:hypothetical protein
MVFADTRRSRMLWPGYGSSHRHASGAAFMRSSSLLRLLSGVASTQASPIDTVSACRSWLRSFPRERKSDGSGKKVRIGSLTSPISPRFDGDPDCERRGALGDRAHVV